MEVCIWPHVGIAVSVLMYVAKPIKGLDCNMEMHCVKCGGTLFAYLGVQHHYVGIDRGNNLLVQIYKCMECGRKYWADDLEPEIGCYDDKANS